MQGGVLASAPYAPIMFCFLKQKILGLNFNPIVNLLDLYSIAQLLS